MGYSYIEGYKYSIAQRQNIEAQLEELHTQIKNGKDVYDMYKQIRHYIYKQIKIDQLAVTKILNDLLQIRLKSEQAFILITFYTANPMLSYKQVADEYNISKQRVHQIISEYAKSYPWLNNLKNIKGEQDSKYIKPKKQKTEVVWKQEQMELF